MTNINIVGFAGSLREGSFNKKILAEAMQGARDAGANTEILDLRDFIAPLYDGDIEANEGLPAPVLAFKERIHACDGMLIASPEHNASVTSALKNAIDWASRPTSKENPEPCFKGKFAGLITTSPGRLGGIRGLAQLREILLNLGVHVIPSQYALPGAHTAFDEKECILEEHSQESTRAVGVELVRFLEAVKTPS